MIINSLSLYIYTYMFYVHDYHLRTISISQQKKCFIKKNNNKKPKLYFHNDCVYFYLEFNKEDSNLRIKCFSKISNFSYYKDLEQQQKKTQPKRTTQGEPYKLIRLPFTITMLGFHVFGIAILLKQFVFLIYLQIYFVV